MPISYTFLWVFLFFLAVSSIKIVRESQRLVVYRLGRFFGLKGPGLIFIIPGIAKCTKINVGDRGELISQDLARIKNADVPVKVVGRVEIGKTVRIQSFMERDAVVVPDSADTGWWGRTKNERSKQGSHF
jgi:regulator of protease activity HflC (stomatin/prohibitin superfamily)